MKLVVFNCDILQPYCGGGSGNVVWEEKGSILKKEKIWFGEVNVVDVMGHNNLSNTIVHLWLVGKLTMCI
jgi:hypothetical protein